MSCKDKCEVHDFMDSLTADPLPTHHEDMDQTACASACNVRTDLESLDQAESLINIAPNREIVNSFLPQDALW